MNSRFSDLNEHKPRHVANQLIVENTFEITCIILSIVVMCGWFLNIEPVLSIVPGSPTMKFNTALIFFISGLHLRFINKNEPIYVIARVISVVTIILIGLITILEYIQWIPFSIDNLFVVDTLSDSNPGRMSPATAICGVLLGLGFIFFHAKSRWGNFIGRYSLKLVGSISLIAAIAFILLIPSENKTSFFQTMAIHTSVLYMLFAILVLLKNPESDLSKMVMGQHAGNRIIRKLLPVVIIFPIVMSYLLIMVINENIVSIDFGVISFAVLFIPTSIIYIAYIANDLNKADIEKEILQHDLKTRNQDLEQFKNGLDQVAIVAITDARGVITYVNQQFCEISQYTEEELIGNTHALINAGYHSKEFFANMWRTIASGTIWSDEIKNKAKDGSYYWVYTAIVPFTDEKGRIVEYLAIRQDITQRKEAEELLKSEFVQKLQYKNKELEQFAYVASHDLQEPLRTITSFTDILAKKYKSDLDELGQKSMGYIQEATHRMSALIKSLLDYSRLDKYQEISTIDCNKLLEDVKNDLAKRISDSKAQISNDPLPTLNGYETPLRLLFQNLIANAIKFQKAGVTPEIHLSVIKKRRMWEFSVKDNGIGIDDEHQEKIFVIFQRLHSKSEFDGTGIGLSHCRKIVDLHGGSIWVSSKVGEGSTFYFTIPFKTSPLH
ncbi:ATP-binding protein [Marinoscillum sp. MHG1-6]|uniref:sensor histidine kinase n=1 Tax=Marinoscillum sp. MHG1-6 TaxID=2959627 RepID=UPI002157FBA3|nr:ATP-binding protein [Marinoscillum sp. MHG1-6]